MKKLIANTSKVDKVAEVPPPGKTDWRSTARKTRTPTSRPFDEVADGAAGERACGATGPPGAGDGRGGGGHLRLHEEGDGS
jgi:hypothetical protein